MSATAPTLRLLVLALLALTGAAVAADRAPVADDPFQSGLLWRISRSGLPDSFVFGTIHVPDPRVSAIPPDALAALARSRVLATELVVRATSDGMLDGETLDRDARLAELIGPVVYADLQRVLAGRDIPPAALDRMKPWAAMLRVQASAVDTGPTLDEQLFTAARALRLPVRSLESAEEQTCAFDVIPMATQVALLQDAIAHPGHDAGARERTIRAWLDADLATLALPPPAARDPALAPHYRALAKHLIEDRTVVMHHSLYVPLRSGAVFAAVGASHLSGPTGLLAMLRDDGYRVTRVR